MKIIIAFLMLLATAASGQLSYVNLTTPHTNTATSSGVISIPSQFTNTFSTVNTNNISIGDPLSTSFNKVNVDLAFLWNYDLTNSFGGGAGGTTNAIPIINGGGLNTTITNTLNLINPTAYLLPSYTASGSTTNPYYIFNSLSVTGLVTVCYTNSPFVLDTNTADETWGTLTNNCGDVLIPFMFNTNGTVDGLPATFTANSVSTNYTFWNTNQVLGSLTAYVNGAGRSVDNGVYTNGVPSANIGTLFNSSHQLLTLWALVNTNLAGSYVAAIYASGSPPFGQIDLFGGYPNPPVTNGYSDYFLPSSLLFVALEVPGFPMPMFNSENFAANPPPTVSFSYIITNGIPTKFISDQINDLWTANYSTNSFTNFSSTFDWVILKPNSSASYTVVSYNPNGGFKWIGNLTTNIVTVCPVDPLYVGQSAVVSSNYPNYFSTEAGACWSTVIGFESGYAVTNLGCSLCNPVYQPLDEPGGSNYISAWNYTTNFYISNFPHGQFTVTKPAILNWNAIPVPTLPISGDNITPNTLGTNALTPDAYSWISGLGGGGGGGNATGNFIQSLNGSGTNTSLYSIRQVINFGPGPITISNGLVSMQATYYVDGQTNTAVYTNFGQPQFVWTNNLSGQATNWEITLNTNGWPYEAFYQGPYNYYTLWWTNSAALLKSGDAPIAIRKGDPLGNWERVQVGIPTAPTGYGVPVSTNPIAILIVTNGITVQMVATFANFPSSYPGINTGTYPFVHGLGHYPSRVDWYLLCTAEDAATGTPAGYRTSIYDLPIVQASYGTVTFQTGQDLNSVSLMVPDVIFEGAGWSLINQNDHNYATAFMSHATNFCFQVVVTP